MRGVCALLIVLLHLRLLGDAPPTHAYLAVDVFFVLSGFVIAGAYEAKLKTGAGVGWFFGVRMARLYPLYLTGLVLGALLALPVYPPLAVAGAFARGALFLPHGLPNDPSFYALNGVFWSLGAELFINLLYGLGGWRLNTKALVALCIACGAGVWALSLANGALNLGAERTLLDLGAAGLRVGFGFPFGVLMWRWHARSGASAGALAVTARPLVPLALLAAVVVLLTLPTTLVAYDPAAITLALPVLFLALVRAPPVAGRTAIACDVLGRLSYPIYVVHYPLADGYLRHGIQLAAPFLGALAYPLGVAGVFTSAVALAWLAHKTIEPAGKRFITDLMVRGRARAAAATARAGA